MMRLILQPVSAEGAWGYRKEAKVVLWSCTVAMKNIFYFLTEIDVI